MHANRNDITDQYILDICTSASVHIQCKREMQTSQD